MLIDTIYQLVQARLNKEQLGYLKPLKYNLFINNSQIKVYNQLLTDLKSNVRKSNWWLDGKNLSNYSQHVKQLLEYFSFEANISPESEGVYAFPENFEYVEDVYNGEIEISKVDYSTFLRLRKNRYAAPSDCNPICSKVGNKLKVLPTGIDPIELHYLRRPNNPKWTFVEFEGKAMFDATANDFQDVDMPKSLQDTLVSYTFEEAALYLKDFQSLNAANQEQSQEAQLENRQ